jgi:hypothetical protein
MSGLLESCLREARLPECDKYAIQKSVETINTTDKDPGFDIPHFTMLV